MAGQEDTAVRMAGYLDKRGKMVSRSALHFTRKQVSRSFVLNRMTTLNDRESK